jgi:sugar phosphate isomerase/epimerase
MDRREMLRLLLCAGGGRALVAHAAKALPARPPLGLALFTVRDEARRDAARTFAAVAAMGYREIDMYPADAGVAPAAARRALDAAGLTCPSSRVAFQSLAGDWDRSLDDAATLGARQVTLASVPAEARTTWRAWEELAELLAKRGQEARARGLGLCYHNHDYELRPAGGPDAGRPDAGVPGSRVPFDLLVAATDAADLRFQLDVYWLTVGGRDPVSELARLGPRVASLHLKDADATPRRAITTVGRGTLDFRAILRAAARAGVRHAFVEEDAPADPMAAARAAAMYLRHLDA